VPIGCPYVEVAHPVGPVSQWLDDVGAAGAQLVVAGIDVVDDNVTLAGPTLLSAYRWNSAVSRITAA